jgi:hypothetical protein
MSKWPMRGHFRYMRFKTFPMTPRTPQCEVFWALLSSFEHSGVPEDSKSPTFPSVGLHPHTWPKWGCDIYGPLIKVPHQWTIIHYCVVLYHIIIQNIFCLLEWIQLLLKSRVHSYNDFSNIFWSSSRYNHSF